MHVEDQHTENCEEDPPAEYQHVNDIKPARNQQHANARSEVTEYRADAARFLRQNDRTHNVRVHQAYLAAQLANQQF